MYIYLYLCNKMSFQTMDIWLDMSDGFDSPHTHCKAELPTIPTHLILVCYPTFTSPLSHFWYHIITLHIPSPLF